MTLRMSAVAVCRSSASRVSLNSRAFSMAITAWSAKLCRSASSSAVNGSELVAIDDEGADRLAVAPQRRAAHRAGARGAGMWQAWPVGHRRIDMVEVGNVNLPVPGNHRRPAGSGRRPAFPIAVRPRVSAWRCHRSDRIVPIRRPRRCGSRRSGRRTGGHWFPRSAAANDRHRRRRWRWCAGYRRWRSAAPAQSASSPRSRAFSVAS